MYREKKGKMKNESFGSAWSVIIIKNKYRRGRLHSSGKNLIHMITDHNHVADIGKIKANEAMAGLKNVAKSTQRSTRSVLYLRHGYNENKYNSSTWYKIDHWLFCCD